MSSGLRKVTSPIRWKIQVMSASQSGDKGGDGVAMTVMLSPMPDAVFGMARTTRGGTYESGSALRCAVSMSSSCGTVMPARILITSLPPSAAQMSRLPRMVDAICGLQPRMTTEASWQPETLSFWRTVRLGVRGPMVSWMDCADCGRVMQAMKRVGSLLGAGEPLVCSEVFGPEAGSEESLDWDVRMPRRMALPSVPGTRYQPGRAG